MYTPLPSRPDMDQLKLQARELRDAFTAGEEAAGLRVRRHRGPAAPEYACLSLRNAQLGIAREHGFTSWARLRQYIDSPARPAASVDEVPVPEKCELDESGKIMLYPYLISNRSQGRQGELFGRRGGHGGNGRRGAAESGGWPAQSPR